MRVISGAKYWLRKAATLLPLPIASSISSLAVTSLGIMIVGAKKKNEMKNSKLPRNSLLT